MTAILLRTGSTAASRSTRQTWPIVGLMLGILFFLVSGFVAYQNILQLRESDQAIRHTHNVLILLEDVLSSAQDAETGQRGYLLTGSASYLDPYRNAVDRIDDLATKLGSETRDNPVQQANLVQLRRHIDAKLAELRETIATAQRDGREAAVAIVMSDRGKVEMDAIRSQLNAMSQEELRLRQIRMDDMAAASRTAIVSSVVASLIGIALTIAMFLFQQRNARARARQQWLQAGQLGLSEAMRGDKSVEALGEAILSFLGRYLGFQAGALFKGEGGRFNRVATLGVPGDADMPLAFGHGDGLLGQAAKEGRPFVLEGVPESYLTIGSALGRDRPRHLMIVPTKADEIVNAVIEIGFFKPIDPAALELLEQVSPSIGIALRSARFRARLQDALEETQRQANELQAQSEELRVSNEELEEQGRALRESQVRLEQQQVELEQTNSQLEEQAQTLENQRDELARAGALLETKASELEQASQYKSDFLANMSHELRTPLNSLLILSKLLGDNAEGNLNPDQVKFARTIESSGNDLLTLINDILDLSKIEAGHIQVQPEPVALQRMVADIRQMFQPIAGQKALAFEVEIAPDCPRVIDTDRMRVEQILKNLLSNAFKFTAQGSVRLTIETAAEERLAFTVADTGIGMSQEQQSRIFEAFHQADGTISRRYGGTGLGLSISRQLARLLGGRITLESAPEQGSRFTLIIPAQLTVEAASSAAKVPAPATPAPAPAPAPVPEPARVQPVVPRSVTAEGWSVEDDRDALVEGRHVLLIIEDDQVFAGIVAGLSRDMGFQCLIAITAEEAVRLAREYLPSAIVLDLGLPDQSGLTVLDRLKHDDATRHIPIHVVSASDHAQAALSLGAIGYLVKPVKREQLAEVLETLSEKLSTRMRRVLIVEDDPVQRDAVGKLLGSDEVETVGVGTAAACLDKLRTETFDCMVLDLTLPDTSGFALLETLSEEGDHGFPPVIVYTGHDLSADDEQRLRRYSSSIIIKGAKSPERLLDEVSLFLHQVVSELPPEQRSMIQKARNRDAVLEGRRILIVEDDVRNVYSLTSVLEPRGAIVQIARNGQEAIDALAASTGAAESRIDLVLMDVMMPVMDGISATRQIRRDAQWNQLPILMLTAKAMPDDQQKCLEAGANDYMAKPIDVDKLLSLVRVWMPR